MKAKVHMNGRLTRDVTSIFANEDGSANRAIFTVACNSTYKKENEKVKTVDFIPCIAWGAQATLLEEWGLKGRQIAIEGTLESYQKPPNEDGEYEPVKIQVRVVEIEFLGFEKSVQEKFDTKKTKSNDSTGNTDDQTAGASAEDLAKMLLGILNGGVKSEGGKSTANAGKAFASALGGLL